MPKALILIADGTEEIEFVTPYDVLVRAGFDVKSAGVKLENETFAVCSRNTRIIPDHASLQAVPPQSAHEIFDVLILPGGGPGAKTLSTYEPVLEMIGNFRKEGKWVAAICAGTVAVVEAAKFGGDNKGDKGSVRVTSHPSVREKVDIEGWEYAEERVVVDAKARVVTSRGPGTALSFSLAIVGLICGVEKRDEVAGPMVVSEALMEGLRGLDG